MVTALFAPTPSPPNTGPLRETPQQREPASVHHICPCFPHFVAILSTQLSSLLSPDPTTDVETTGLIKLSHQFPQLH